MAANKDTKEDATVPTTPSGEATSGNVGLSPDIYADSIKAEEDAAQATTDWDEVHKVPEEALTDEAKEAMAANEERLEEEQAERDEKREAAETAGRSRSDEAKAKDKGEGLGKRESQAPPKPTQLPS